MSATIRPMLEADLPLVYAIEKTVYPLPWTYTVLRDCITLGFGNWVIEEVDCIRGYVIISYREGNVHILNIAVDPCYQHQGYGRALLQHVIVMAKKKKAQAIYLEVRVTNRVAIKLYEKMGFNQIDVKENYYPTGTGFEDAYLYAMELIDDK